VEGNPLNRIDPTGEVAILYPLYVVVGAATRWAIQRIAQLVAAGIGGAIGNAISSGNSGADNDAGAGAGDNAKTKEEEQCKPAIADVKPMPFHTTHTSLTL